MTNRLRVARAERGVNQEQVASAIGVYRDRYFRIEKGYAEPTKDEQAQLAEFFGMPVKKLFPPSAEGAVA